MDFGHCLRKLGRSFFAAASLALGSAQAQSPAPEASTTPLLAPSATPMVFSEVTLREARSLQQAALGSDYAWRQAAHLSNNIGPRLTGSAQAAKAVEYVAGELRALGCEVQLEKTMVPHWVRGEERAELTQFSGEAEGTTQKVVLTALGGSVATPAEGITAEVLAVRDFDELKVMPRERVAGKIVLFDHSFDKQMAAQGHGGDAYGEAVVYRSDGPTAAAKQGAVACLVKSVGGADYRIPHTGLTQYGEGTGKIPAAAVSAEDAELMTALTREGAVKMHLVLTPQTLPEVESANVIGDIKGSERPDELVMVSGHLDSWDLGTGAIDDAAGVAVAMETAHLIRQLHLQPKRTLRVIAWMNEENGSRGSKQYERDHATEFAKHFAVNETDSGAGHPVGLNVKGK
ncbi:MAG: peptidase M28 family protein, partial [Chthoniobacterales bacterium]